MSPRCSVVVPAYNVEEYVAQSVASALAQTYTDREVIVVNDGSTDGTAEALRPFLDRIIYIEQPNRGASAARNTAIAAASGEYIALLDADDVWFPNRLEHFVAYLDAHPEFGIATGWSNKRRSRFHWDDQGFWITQGNFVAAMSVVRRELFERHGGFDETLRGSVDWELWIRFLVAGERAGNLPSGMAYKRQRQGSISHDWREHLRNELRMLERVVAKGIVARGLPGRLEIARGRVALYERRRRDALGHFRTAVRDGELAISTRVKALPFAIAPSVMWHVYAASIRLRRIRRARRARVRARAADVDTA